LEFCRGILHSYEKMFPRKNAASAPKNRKKWGKQQTNMFYQNNKLKRAEIIIVIDLHCLVHLRCGCDNMMYGLWPYGINPISKIKTKMNMHRCYAILTW
jgi:hypothetical protein